MEDYQTKEGRMGKKDMDGKWIWGVVSVFILIVIVYLAFGGELRDVPVGY